MKSRESFSKGKKQGDWLYYFDNGQLKIKKTLKKDMREMLRSNLKECKRVDKLIRSYGGECKMEYDYICIDISST